MTPEDLSTVQHSWSELQIRRDQLTARLGRRFAVSDPSSPIAAGVRAEWLVGAVEALVGLLAAPSRLASRARLLAATWPDPCTAPSYLIEGRAWMDAAGDCLPAWSEHTEAAWRQAWLLLSEVLAAEALSPFTDDPVITTHSDHNRHAQGQLP